MGFLKKAFDKVEEAILVVLFAFMALMNFANVVARYCFSSSFSFTEEITITAFVWVTMFGIAAGYKKVSHLGMSFFVDLMPQKGRMVMTIFSMICSVCMLSILLYFGIDMVRFQIQLGSTTAALKMPMYVQGLSIPVGTVFIIIRAIQSGISEFKRIQKMEKTEV